MKNTKKNSQNYEFLPVGDNRLNRLSNLKIRTIAGVLLVGARRVYMMAQQICVLVYASSIGVCQFTVNSTTIAKMVYENVYSSSIIIAGAFTFLQSFIYHNFFFFP